MKILLILERSTNYKEKCIIENLKDHGFEIIISNNTNHNLEDFKYIFSEIKIDNKKIKSYKGIVYFLKKILLKMKLEYRIILLKNIFKDMGIFIIDENYKLDKDTIELIKKLRENIFVFSVNNSIKYLSENDIIPDLALIEETKYSENKYDNKSIIYINIKDINQISNEDNNLMTIYTKNEITNDQLNNKLVENNDLNYFNIYPVDGKVILNFKFQYGIILSILHFFGIKDVYNFGFININCINLLENINKISSYFFIFELYKCDNRSILPFDYFDISELQNKEYKDYYFFEWKFIKKLNTYEPNENFYCSFKNNKVWFNLNFDFNSNKYFYFEFDNNIKEIELSNCKELKLGKDIRQHLVSVIDENNFLWGECADYGPSSLWKGVYLLDRNEIAKDYRNLNDAKIILDDKDSIVQKGYKTYYDTPIQYLEFNNLIFLYARYNSSPGVREVQVFMYKKYEDISKRTFFSKNIVSLDFSNKYSIYFIGGLTIFENFIYSFVFVYPKDIINDDHRYIKTEIFICKSNDGLNFTKIINLGYLKNNGLPFKIDIHNNSVNVYYIINFKSKMITFNKIYDI